MPRAIVIADDLTGAAELGAAAGRRGLRVALLREPRDTPPADAELWVFDTDTRELTATAASARLRVFAERLQAADARDARVFKKTDSVLRGHCAAESELVAQAVGASRLLLAAGNPRRGREVRGGRLLIDGVPVDRSPFRDDPTRPAHSADVGELWRRGGATGRPPADLAPEVTGQTLATLAAAACAPATLPVGALDFFEAWLDALGLVGARTRASAPELPAGAGALVVCGSRDGWPDRSARFRRHGWPVAETSAPTTITGPRLLGLGVTPRATPEAAVRELATRAAAHVRATQPGLLCLEGGATASAVLAALGWRRFELVGEVAAGTACLRPAETGTLVLVKPGSYAWPPAVEAAWAAA